MRPPNLPFIQLLSAAALLLSTLPATGVISVSPYPNTSGRRAENILVDELAHDTATKASHKYRATLPSANNGETAIAVTASTGFSSKKRSPQSRSDETTTKTKKKKPHKSNSTNDSDDNDDDSGAGRGATLPISLSISIVLLISALRI
ncbi:hypothetical protein F5Y19DRAFT_423742 [Xylariaceae sp. FL1651]|nr:hypothetical protein F5Y19DRAFT_423742 [Xylariaceae sp. FL1651]